MKSYDGEWNLATEMADKINRCYEKYGVDINIRNKDIDIAPGRFIYRVKLKAGTRVNDIKRFAQDVQVKLKLSLFNVVQRETAVYIVAYPETAGEIEKNAYVAFLKNNTDYKNMGIAHLIGVNSFGETVIKDITKYPHIFTAGTTGSGKTVGLKNILVSTGYKYSPDKVQLLIGDMADDLVEFNALPHLVCPIIRDIEKFDYAMKQLKQEMDRRIKLKRTQMFHSLPIILLVVDEFTSFVSGSDSRCKNIRHCIEELLRRGRHAKIHLILAAHNPTKNRLGIDVSDIPTKMVFRVARFSNSLAVLGQGGAEKLLGKGDMYFHASDEDNWERIQGVNIEDGDVGLFIRNIISKWKKRGWNKIKQFKINLSHASFSIDTMDMVKKVRDTSKEEKMLADAIIWVLQQENVSCNQLMKQFSWGWNKASSILEKLFKLGIVDDLESKLARRVLIESITDLPEPVIQLLEKFGMVKETEQQQEIPDGYVYRMI